LTAPSTFCAGTERRHGVDRADRVLDIQVHDVPYDTIGVDPAASGKHVGRALVSQLLANLTSLHVESVRTEVEWNRFDLLRFLDRCGFRPGQQLSLSRPLV